MRIMVSQQIAKSKYFLYFSVLFFLILGLYFKGATNSEANTQIIEPYRNDGIVSHAIAMHGEPELSEGFTHFPYANPDAPQGGTLKLSEQGTFDSLNPYIIRGISPSQIRNYVVEPLMARSFNEAFTLYGHVAEYIETNEQRDYVVFYLNRDAKFSDGEAITAKDILFSWNLLKEQGRPNHRSYYSKVDNVTILDDHRILFDLSSANDRELVLILGLIPILPSHIYENQNFEETALTPLIGSGPYIVSEVEAGQTITLKRNPDYWAKAMPAMAGHYNFDTINVTWYRDQNTRFEAFKRGLSDIWFENDPAKWQQAYDFPAYRDGNVTKVEIETGLPKGMSAFVMNTRSEFFSDINVRKAMQYLFDFEWINRTLYFGSYERTQSYYQGSYLSSANKEMSEMEKLLLADFPDAVENSIAERGYVPPTSDGTGRNRNNIRAALRYFRDAGYSLENGQLIDIDTKNPISFEFLIGTKQTERLALAFSRTLKQVGIDMSVRLVDPAQYDRRLQNYDFDMIQYFWSASLSPGNEQAFYWSSDAAVKIGTRNYMGASSDAVDEMIKALLVARDKETFISAARALDRVLLSQYYVIPLFYLPKQWLAHWNHININENQSLYGALPSVWWYEPID